MSTDFEVGIVRLDLQRIRLKPGDLLGVTLPESFRPTQEMVMVVRRIVTRALEEAGLGNTVLVVPYGTEFSAVEAIPAG